MVPDVPNFWIAKLCPKSDYLSLYVEFFTEVNDIEIEI